MHRGGHAIGGRGIVLLAMLFLAIGVGVGAKGLAAITDSAEDPAPTTASSSINAPGLPTGTTETAQQIAPTVAPAYETPPTTESAGSGVPTAEATKTESNLNAGGTDLSDGDAIPVSARAVYAYNMNAKKPLYQLNADERMSVGSIVKVATALVVVEHVSLDEVVTIDASDLVDPAIYSNMGLIEGDQLTVLQLLEGLLVPSGGDAAQALARYVGYELSGSKDPDVARAAFVDEMNAYVESIGLTNTHFANATGDEAEDNYSSAEDVAWLAASLMDNVDLAEIVAMPSYDFVSEGGNQYTQVTTNQLLGIDGIVGVKTGSTGEAGGCVVLAQENSDGQLIVLTILGSDIAYDDLNRIVADARWDDAREVLQTLGTGAS